MATKKYVSLERLQEYHALLEDHIATGDDSVKLYADGLAAGKADKEHIHDDIYYTEAEIDTKLEAVNASIAGITSGSTKVQDAVHADSSTSADEATHAATADNATEANHAISADSATKATQDAAGNVITETYETKTDASAKLDEAKEYADNAVAAVKNDLLNGAGEAYDTLKELGDLISENVDAIQALETVATGKADKEHTHILSEITDFETITFDEIDEICGFVTEGALLETDVDELMAQLED